MKSTKLKTHSELVIFFELTPTMSHLLAVSSPQCLLATFLVGTWCAVLCADDASKPSPSATRSAYFERHIRPVLAEHCYECHSTRSKKTKGGLALDSPTGLRAGGDSGQVVIPGKPNDSLLLSALRHDALEMPPNKRLPQSVVDHFTLWIKQGAPYPDATPPHSDDRDSRAASHWAFQPVRRPTPPVVHAEPNLSSDVDRFIRRELEQNQIESSPPADRRTLIRRAYFDLIGLPPSPKAVAEFIADPSPHAYRTVVDQLLESPLYGERWGRYWLDVARYADNKGYVFYFEKTFPWSWAYRDYVIRAFNEDLPYDRFILEQLAADHLDLGDDQRPLTAMGFLTVGPRFTNNTHDILDDRIDVVTRGLQGLTFSCARCHDHKYDPMTQADYYALYGIFRSSFEPLVLPEFQTAPDNEAYHAFQSGLRERETKLAEFIERQRLSIVAGARERIEEYLMAAHYRRHHPTTDNFMLLTDKGALIPVMVQRWEQYLKRSDSHRDPIWTVWHAFSALSDSDFPDQAPVVHRQLFHPPADTNAPSIHPQVRAAFATKPPSSMRDVARTYASLFAEIRQAWQTHQDQADATQRTPGLPDPQKEALRQVLFSADSPANLPREFDWGFLQLLPDRPTQAEFQKLLKEVEQWTMKQPAAPPRAMVLRDRKQAYEPYLFVRGNPNRRGRRVDRCIPPPIAPPGRKPVASGSGRLQLARAIANADNPLTARVLVNRVWQHHFGTGLVTTPSDFGLRSQPPSHPELLDWLAVDFIENGWSIKHLHRRIMNTAVYQQRSSPTNATQALQHDPNNRLLWKFPRRRLDFEAMRDSLLYVAGALDTQQGGPPVNILSGFASRRSVYGFVDRMDVATLLRTFDFPEPTASSGGREQTTVPPQGLYFLNNDFVHECARRVADRTDVSNLKPQQRVSQIYDLLFGRPPDPQERKLALAYLQTGQPASKLTAWKYGYGAVNEQQQRVQKFTELTSFVNGRWQGGKQLPDPKLGWVFVDRRGGHPAVSNDRCCIRRWVSPIAGTVTISGKLAHAPEPGNGVRARMISSKHGLLGEWSVDMAQATTGPFEIQVESGTTIDFVVDAQGHITHDEHEWTLQIDASGGASWDSVRDFQGEPTNIWTDFAHALLMTNEFVFID